MAIHFDVVYTLAGAIFEGHPAARSLGTGLVGKVQLANGEQVFVTWLRQPMVEALRRYVERLRSAHLLDAAGNPRDKSGVPAFGKESNQDADDGTQVGMLLDVTRK